MFVSVDKNKTIRAISKTLISSADTVVVETPQFDSIDPRTIIGKKALFGPAKPVSEWKIAMICNWGDHCGIATYSQALVNDLRNKVKEVKIFSERNVETSDDVVRCWSRGESMMPALQEVLQWQPDFIHIQHEFGIFPKATHFLKMLEILSDIPYAITFHSVYQHFDKTICTAYVKNAIVHSEKAKEVLAEMGHRNSVYVVPHGCLNYESITELWNIFQNDYSIVQFGFGFGYKGVDIALEAVRILKQNDPKFKDIFYCYMCSENPHTRSVHDEYYSYLKGKVTAAGLENNVVILRGFVSDDIIRNYLRTAKLAIFPYKTDPNNCVYGASGAVRHAMANGVPVIASDSHLFDDLDGVLPRASSVESLAQEIDKVFSNETYRKSLIAANLQFMKDNNWDITADRHISIYESIAKEMEDNSIRITDYRLLDTP